MIEQAFQDYLKGKEFQSFLNITHDAMKECFSKDISEEKTNEALLNMGRSYNHFVFTLTEDLLAKMKKEDPSCTPEVMAQAINLFLNKFQEVALKAYQEPMLFFLNYRAQIKQTAFSYAPNQKES